MNEAVQLDSAADAAPFTPPHERFLAALGEGLSVAGAAKLAGVGRQTVYDWRKRDGEFAAAWDDAIETGTDNLEDEARRRPMSTSDTLMIFLLKARRPDKYKERRASELSGPGGGPIRTEWDFSHLSDEEFEAYCALSAKVRGPDERDASEIVRRLAPDRATGK